MPNSSKAQYHKIRCPECLAPIWLKADVALWYPVTCPECHTALEVNNLSPLEVDYMTMWDEYQINFPSEDDEHLKHSE